MPCDPAPRHSPSPLPPSRRQLLRRTALAGAFLPLAGQPLGTRAEEDAPVAAVRRKRIPRSGELLPCVGLGTSRTLDADPAAENADLLEVVRLFLDAGGSLIDSSPMYGRSESVVGALLGRLGRKDVFFATKVWTDEGREAGIRQMEDSIRKMGAGPMDLMQVHNLVAWETHLPVLREWKAAGRIRYLGITEMRNFELVEKLVREAELDFIQIPYSLADRRVEERVLPACLEHGVAVLCMRPFERGRLFGAFEGKEIPPWATELGIASWAQFFLKFLLGHPAVTCPIPATSKPHHLADNMRGGTGPLPDEATRRRMVALLG